MGGCQDIHFSQYNLSPLNMNPALTGAFDGDYRFVGNHRRQWASVTTPYQTFGLSAEARSPFGKLPGLSGGLSMYLDKAGDSEFTTLQVNLAGAYEIRVSKDSLKHVVIGVQSGVTERRMAYDKLTFDSQYNGSSYDQYQGSNETFPRGKRVYPNLNFGLVYRQKFGERNTLTGGVSWFNVTKPKQSYFNNNVIKLDQRLDFHIRTKLKVAEKFDLIPSVRGQGQGTFRELILGANVKYILSDEQYKYRAVYLGAWMRTGDAGYLSVGMDYDSWHVGLSYDLNFSNLRPASLGRGGLEIAVIYILRNLLPERVPYKICPDYI